MIAHTVLSLSGNTGIPFGGSVIHEYMETDDYTKDADALAEFAGRTCYQSFHKPNEATRSNFGYMENIRNQGHTSVLEHAHFSFYLQGISRSCSHEIVRHRHHNYSQLSQRYVDQSSLGYVVPPAYRSSDKKRERLAKVWANALIDYNELVEEMVEEGAKRKEARQAARAVLPEMTETKMVISGNGWAWIHFLNKRMHPTADEEIREVAGMIKRSLITKAPNIFNGAGVYNPGVDS